ncbi:hypothetical protein PFISCL1PPCAC_1721, partial [Pristionchus fissidentatus]
QYACTFLATFNRFTAIVIYEMHEKLVLLTWRLWYSQIGVVQDFLDVFYPICSDIFCLSLPFYTILLPGPVNRELKRWI